MTRRRIIEPGTTWALCRRTTRRYFLLTPDQGRQLEQCYWYCLGVAAQRYGVLVHAGCLMSTHSHEVVTDVRGELPRFLQEFHRLLALTTKALGRISPSTSVGSAAAPAWCNAESLTEAHPFRDLSGDAGIARLVPRFSLDFPANLALARLMQTSVNAPWKRRRRLS